MKSHATTARPPLAALLLPLLLLLAPALPARGQSPEPVSTPAESPAAETPAFETLGWRPVGPGTWCAATASRWSPASGDDVFVLPRAPDSDFGDPVFGARYSLKKGQGQWNLVLEGSAKVAVGDRDRLSSTGNNDFGLQTWRGHTVYRLGITENLSNFSNTPDIGVTLQVGYVVQGERGR